MEDGNIIFGYEKPMKHDNYEYLEAQKTQIQKKKVRWENKILLTLPNGAKERLKKVAEKQERRYHTIATEAIMKYIQYIEKSI